MAPKKHLKLFAIIMINVIAVDSIRTLPIAAQFGFSLVFYYLIAGLFFLLPSALVAAELGTAWPKTGGLYIWIREAFGLKVATVMIWLNWVYNLAWFPTIMALIAATIAYAIHPDYLHNKIFIISVILVLFWLATLLNCFGMKVSSWISTIGAIFGTMIPMIFITILAIVYYMQNNPIQIPLTIESFFPSHATKDELGYFSTVLFSLVGLELVATHTKEMVDPSKHYPKALAISVVIILTSIICSSLAIAIVVPESGLSLAAGIIQAFEQFFQTFSLQYLTPIVAVAIITGVLACVSAWIIGPTKGIMVASQDKALPSFLTKTNKHNVPLNALMTQGVIVTFLSLIYLFMPSLNSGFAILTIITSQLAMIVYITLFAAALKLHFKHGHVKRIFKIPGGNFGMILTTTAGMTISTLAIIAGFIKPDDVAIHSYWTYLTIIVSIMVTLSIVPLFFSKIVSK